MRGMPPQKSKSQIGKGNSAKFVKIVHLKAIPRPNARSFATVDEAIEFIRSFGYTKHHVG